MIEWVEVIVFGIVVFVVAVLCVIGKIIVRKEMKPWRRSGRKRKSDSSSEYMRRGERNTKGEQLHYDNQLRTAMYKPI